MGASTQALCARTLSIGTLSLAVGFSAVAAPPRVEVDSTKAPYSAIKRLMVGTDDNCTAQFASSRQVATTAAHCFDLIMLGSREEVAIRDHDNQVYRVRQVYIPENYDPQDTANKAYFDKAIIVFDRPLQSLTQRFALKAYDVDPQGHTPLDVWQAGFSFDQYGEMTSNTDCALNAPRFHNNGHDFIIEHNCGIAPGDSGSAALVQGTLHQKALITSLNYAVPVTSSFIKAYNNIASKLDPAPDGFIKTNWDNSRATAPVRMTSPPVFIRTLM